MKLNIKAFSLACGIIWGLGLFCLTWWIIAFEGLQGNPPSSAGCTVVIRSRLSEAQ
jgi:hypothetical protein